MAESIASIAMTGRLTETQRFRIGTIERNSMTPPFVNNVVCVNRNREANTTTYTACMVLLPYMQSRVRCVIGPGFAS